MSVDKSFAIGRIDPGGLTFDARTDQPLLVSLEQAGLSWPSACRVGSCRTCLSTLLQGQVRYEMAWPGITPEEKAEGCVLPCVAFPVGDVVLRDPLQG